MRIKRWLTVSTAAASTLLLLGSAAYACTAFAGKETVTQSGSTTSFRVGDPSLDMDFCADSGSQDGTLTRGSNFTVTVARAPVNGIIGGQECGPNNQLPNGTYNVYYSTGADSHCMFSYDAIEISNSSFSVSNGAGSESGVQVPTTASTGAGKVCVGAPMNSYAMEVHMTFS